VYDPAPIREFALSAVVAVVLVLPVVPVALSLAGLVISTYPPMLDEDAVELLAVVLELCEPPCRHPLTVMLPLSLSPVELAVVVLGVWAIAIVAAQTNAAAIHAVRFIYHLCEVNACNRGTRSNKNPVRVPGVLCGLLGRG
jgi:hypothetical protein